MFLRQRDSRLGVRASDLGFTPILIKPSYHG